MKKTIIKAPIEAAYLSQVFKETNDLPHNCLFNKVVCGSGGTTVVLANSESYIICVPFVSLIENKCAQFKDVLGVHGRFKPFEIKRYLNNKEIPVKKIMVTYDSLEKLMEYINPSEFRLLIDELHILFSSILFRQTAVNGVLDNYMKFKSYTFMTATMLEEEFILKELKHLPVVEIEWSNTREVTVESIQCTHNVVHATVELVNQFLSGEVEGNAHIFVNSVEFIKSIILACKLNDDNTRAIWSQYNLTKLPILKSKTTSPVKKINFYTSCSWEGCDILDKKGKTYIVSDASKSNTLLDISTSFIQIAGRVRDSEYFSTITHIFKETRYSNISSYEEFKVLVENLKVKNERIIAQFNMLDEDAVLAICKPFMSKTLEKADNQNYISYIDNKFIVDENMAKFDLFNYKITKHLYQMTINLTKEFEQHGFTVSDSINNTKIKDLAKINVTDTFKETVLETKLGDKDYLRWAFNKYSFLEDAIKYIGYEGIKDLDYHIGNIKYKVLSMSNKSSVNKALEYIKMSGKLQVGSFYSNSTIKFLLTEAYDKFEIKTQPKLTDINNIFSTVITSINVDKKKVNGIRIIK